MIIRWTPEPGADVIEFPFRPLELMSEDAEDIELAGSRGSWETFDGWHRSFLVGNRYAERVALWICRRRENPDLVLTDVRFRMDGLQIVFDLEEKKNKRRELIEKKFDDTWSADDLETILGMPYLKLPEGEVDDAPLPPSAVPTSTTPTAPENTGTE